MASTPSAATSKKDDTKPPTPDGTIVKAKERKYAPVFSPGDTIVTFLIGPDPEPSKFIVHKVFACHHSPVLNAAFNSTMIEGQTQTYRLEDTTNEAFSLFVAWLYTQKINIEVAEDQTFKASALPILWVLAEKLLIPSLQNLTIDSIEQYRKDKKVILGPSIKYIYSNTSAGSPLRKLLVDQCASSVIRTAFSENPQYYPQEMLIELAGVMRGMITDNKQPPAIRDMAQFHVNEDDE